MDPEHVTLPSDPEVRPAAFVVGGRPGGDVEVRISFGIIDRFSEGLYSSPNKAFEELVSNAYDAGARRVWVRVPDNLDATDAYIAVLDDGVSMDLDGLRDLWQVGVSPKRPADGEEVVRAGRPPIGKFGIGKLATYVLAAKLTYVCLSEGTIRAVTMDYGLTHGGMSDPVAMKLGVVELTPPEARQALERVPGTGDEAIETFFGGDPPSTWTAAILSDLKPRGRAIQRGRLRWILRVGLPIGDEFQLWFNKEHLPSAALDVPRSWDFVVGETDKALDNWPYSSNVSTDALGRPGVVLPTAGFVRGSAQLYDRSIKGGKSEERIRSHGFFVKVRERLINIDDETFGIDVELSHGVLTRFRMEVCADGLDAYIASPRESIQESSALTELRNYLLAVFNRARSFRAKQEEATTADVLASAERIALPPAALSTGPLRRVLQRAIDGDEAVGQLLELDANDLILAATAIEARDPLLRQVLIEPLGHEKPLVRYSVERRAAIVNANHPFVSNYLDVHGAAEPLRLVGVTELLTQIYMLDEDVDPLLVQKVLRRRDEFLRALVNIHPRSAPVIARQLRDAASQKDELEDAVADSLELLGFEVTRISGAGEPDGIARAKLGAREEGGGSRNYAVTYDAKSSSHEAIKAATAGTQTLRKHRKAHDADYSLLVAPGFQGAAGEDTSIVENCATDCITPLTVEQLARIVEIFPFRSLTPASLRTLLDIHTPGGVDAWMENLVSGAPAGPPPPITQILDLTRELSDRQDAVTIDSLSTALKLQHNVEIPVTELRGLVRGLAALAPDGLWYESDRLALNASIPAIVAELRATIEPLDDEIAGVFKAVLAPETTS